MTETDSATIARDDLQVIAEAMLLRLQLREKESRRVARMRELIAASSDLSGALSVHTHHARVHCQGSPGTGDLIGESEVLFRALATFAGLVRDVAQEYRAIAREPMSPVDISSALGNRPTRDVA